MNPGARIPDGHFPQAGHVFKSRPTSTHIRLTGHMLTPELYSTPSRDKWINPTAGQTMAATAGRLGIRRCYGRRYSASSPRTAHMTIWRPLDGNSVFARPAASGPPMRPGLEGIPSLDRQPAASGDVVFQERTATSTLMEDSGPALRQITPAFARDHYHRWHAGRPSHALTTVASPAPGETFTLCRPGRYGISCSGHYRQRISRTGRRRASIRDRRYDAETSCRQR